MTAITDVRSQTTQFFTTLGTALEAQILSMPLPAQGATLGEAAPDLLGFLDQLATDIDDALDAIVPDADPEAHLAQIQAAVEDLPYGVTASVAGGVLSFTFDTSATPETRALGSASLAEDFGLGAIGLTAEGSLSLEAEDSFVLAFSYDEATGEMSVDPGTNIALKVAGSASYTAEGSLGFLPGVLISDGDPDTPEVALEYNIDLENATVSSLTTESVSVRVTGTAGLDLALDTTAPSSLLPTLSTGVNFGVTFADAGFEADGFDGDAYLEFDEITLQVEALGTLLGTVLAPIDEVTSVFPLGPVIDALSKEIKFLSALAQFIDGSPDPFRVVDLAAIFASAGFNAEYIDFVIQAREALDLLETISEFADTGIPLGTFAASTETADALLNGEDVNADALLETGVTTSEGNGLTAFTDAVSGSSGGGTFDLGSFLQIPLLSDEGPQLAAQFLLNSAGAAPVTIFEFDLPPLELSSSIGLEFPIVPPIVVGVDGIFGGGLNFDFGYDTAGLTADGEFDFFDGFYLAQEPDSSGGFEPAVSLFAGVDASVGLSLAVISVKVGGGILGELGLNFADNDANPGDGRAHFTSFALPCIFDTLTGALTAGVFAKIRFGIGPFGFEKKINFFNATLARFDVDIDCSSPLHGQDEPILPTAGLATEIEDDTLRLNMGDFADEVQEDLREQDEEGAFVEAEAFAVRAGDTGVRVEAYGFIQEFDTPSVIRAEAGAGDDAILVEVDIDADIDAGADDDAVITAGGNDTIRGGDGDDGLQGGDGDDELFGEGDDDLLEGGLGADLLDGGDGFDQVTFENSATGVQFSRQTVDGQDQLVGTGGEAQGDVLISIEHLVGSQHFDILFSSATEPEAQAVLEGLAGNDWLFGSVGRDLLIGGLGADLINGDDGEDIAAYYSSEGAVHVDLANGIAQGGDAQFDQLISIEGLGGSFYNDSLRGDDQDNILEGGAGDDELEGRIGNDSIFGDTGNDLVLALGDGDNLNGGGVNNVSDLQDADLLSYRKATGDVTVDLALGTGSVDGVDGEDIIAFALQAEDPAEPFEAPLTELQGISSFEQLEGSDQNDLLRGDAADNLIIGRAGLDEIFGLAGSDTIIGGLDADVIDGGAASDWVDYSASDAGITLFLSPDGTPSNSGGHAEGDLLTSIENVIGTAFDDEVTGSAERNRFELGLGDDFADGGSLDPNDIDSIKFDLSGLQSSSPLNLVTFLTDDEVVEGFHTAGPGNSTSFTSIEEFDVYATVNNDTILLLADGDDFIRASAGDDIVNVGEGSDRVFGEEGDDFIGADAPTPTRFSGVGGLDPDELDGGAGIDALNVGLSQISDDVVLIMAENPVENPDQLLVLSNGTVIRNFEEIRNVATGAGNDVLSQPGEVDNLFDTGAGNDIIAPGLGIDRVIAGENDVDVTDIDLLVLDYSTLPEIPIADGTAGGIITTFEILEGTNATIGQVFIDDVTDRKVLDFTNVEQLAITGTNTRDAIIGANDPLYAGPGNLLNGIGGDDTITGSRASDTILGGDGDDSLLAGSSQLGFDSLNGEAGDDFIDGVSGLNILVGGLGADVVQAGNEGGNYIVPGVGGAFDGDATSNDVAIGDSSPDFFILGDENGLHYGDLLDVNAPGASQRDFLEIRNFDSDRGDLLLLVGSADDYQVSVTGTGVQILEEQANGPAVLIALLDGLTAFDLETEATYFGRAGGPIFDPGFGIGGEEGEGDPPPFGLLPITGVSGDPGDPDVPGPGLPVVLASALALDTPNAANEAGLQLVSLSTPNGIAAASSPQTESDDNPGNRLIGHEVAHVSPSVLAQIVPVIPGSDDFTIGDDGDDDGRDPDRDDDTDLPVPDPATPSRIGSGISLQAGPAPLIGARLENLVGTATSYGAIETDGDARGFGTLLSDYLGLNAFDEDAFDPSNPSVLPQEASRGGVVSTGIARRLDGENQIDGGLLAEGARATQFDLSFEEIGEISGSQIFRADLSGIPVDILSLRINDSNSGVGGGEGAFSGFDIDSIHFSRVLLDNLDGFGQNDGAAYDTALAPLNVFDFSVQSTVYEPGTQRNAANLDLRGSVNGMMVPGLTSLDRTNYLGANGLTLGDGGSVAFNLTDTIAAPRDGDEPLYLYIAEGGLGNQGETIEGLITVSNALVEKPADLSTDFGAEGAADDRLLLSQDFDVDLGSLGDGDGFYMRLLNIVIATEELLEYIARAPDDAFSVRLNGEEIAFLSDGASATIDNLALTRLGNYHPDLVYNGLGVPGPGGFLIEPGAALGETRADAFTEVLTVAGNVVNGTNTIEIEVADTRDGLLDSAILYGWIDEAVQEITGDADAARVDGTVGDDVIRARAAATILGGTGLDHIFGSDEADIIIGGAGWDRMTGNGGADIFVVNPGAGVEIITDFNLGEDRLSFASSADAANPGFEGQLFDIARLSDVPAVGTDATFAFEDGTTIVLEGVASADLTLGDLILPSDFVQVKEGSGAGDDPSSTHASLEDAINSADPGDLVEIVGPSPQSDPVQVTKTGLIIAADETYSGALVLDPAVEDLSLDGTGTFDVTGNDLANTLKGSAGPETMRPLGGEDRITLGEDADAVLGAPGDLFGDVIEDFTGADQIVFESEVIKRTQMSVEGSAPVALSLDRDDDGTPEGSVGLEGDFSTGDFMAVSDGKNTVVTFETFLPTLQEGDALGAGAINGILNQAFLTGDGASEFRVSLQDVGIAGFDNVIGVYEIEQSGQITDTRLLFENASQDAPAVARITDVEDGNRLGFFIVQDAAEWAATLETSDVLRFVNGVGEDAGLSDGSDLSLAVNDVASEETVFHSFAAALNSDAVQHAVSGVDPGGLSITVGFEDLTGGGDMDYQDVVFRVEVVEAVDLL